MKEAAKEKERKNEKQEQHIKQFSKRKAYPNKQIAPFLCLFSGISIL